MKNLKFLFIPFLLLTMISSWSCKSTKDLSQVKSVEPVVKVLPVKTGTVQEEYTKKEVYIKMRDGVQLFTVIYTPKSASSSKTYPILLKRTPYSCKPYGPEAFPEKIGPSKYLMEEGFIVVYQDVRGRWMSEGTYDNMRPQIADKKSNKDIDESSDTYDSIDWLIKNVAHHNGRVGQWGISYPGFYTTVGAVDAHPALKASSPQAPIADFYFDDFHHRGAYLLSYFMATTVFGYQKDGPTKESWYPFYDPGTPDMYRFFLEMGPLKNGDKIYGKDNFFWQQLKDHPNYDAFWQKRDILPHLKNIKHPIMTVGGWFDAEDLYGPLMTYKTIEKNNPGIQNTIVMGPWSHGDWARDKKRATIGWVHFGDNISDFFQRKIEYDFFMAHLKGNGQPDLPEAYMFDTGAKKWALLKTWPPQNVKKKKLYLRKKGELSWDNPLKNEGFSEYISDPAKPVPFKEEMSMGFTPRPYMTGDQRFASRRPDVLTFQSEPLEKEITLSGEILSKLKVSTSGTDSDWIVKLIDVYPGDTPDFEDNPAHIKMGHFEQMVRSEVIRGRYRNSFEKPEAFTPNKITDVELPLQDVLHTFKKGHRIMVHIQSTWFPLIDRNPQTFVDNIFYADEADFIKATQRVFHDLENASYLEIDVME